MAARPPEKKENFQAKNQVLVLTCEWDSCTFSCSNAREFADHVITHVADDGPGLDEADGRYIAI